jgi:hypothetical protein
MAGLAERRGGRALTRVAATSRSVAYALRALNLPRPPEPDRHGREVLRLTPLELLERRAHLVPPPRIHRHRYDGVLAPNARLRSTVVSIGRPLSDEVPVNAEPPGSSASPGPASHPVAPPGRAQKPAPTGGLTATARARSTGMRWAQLLARIYEVLPLLSPACSGEMRIISFITLPSTVERILLHLDLPHRAPCVSPARGPPQGELDLDQTPAFDLTAPDAAPEFEFDQSTPEDWEL